jgi:hypothetical protein
LTNVRPGECVICEGENKVDLGALELVYRANGGTSFYQSKATCMQGQYPSSAELTFYMKDNVIINIHAEDGNSFVLQGNFQADTIVDFSNWGQCKFHTSCSQPLVVGDLIGPFEIVGAPLNGCLNTPPVAAPTGGSSVDAPTGGSSVTPPAPTPVAECVICDANNYKDLTSLTLRYTIQGYDSVHQTQATCGFGTYPASPLLDFTLHNGVVTVEIEDTETFTLYGNFEATTQVSIEDWGTCQFDTSCAEALVVGDYFGPFQVIHAPNEGCIDVVDPPTGGSGEAPSPSPPGNCVICDCDNKIEPLEELLIRYHQEGQNSMYQTKATCYEGQYPFTDTLTFYYKDDVRQTVTLQDGDSILLQGVFQADTLVEFASGLSCKFHTSCSQPLVVGDRIGPFEILGSPQAQCTTAPTLAPFDEPVGGTPAPTLAPVDEPVGGSGTPAPFAPRPTGAPSAESSNIPSAEPSYTPSYEPSNTPSDEPSNIPSAIPSGFPSMTESPAPSPSPTETPTSHPSETLSQGLVDMPTESPFPSPSPTETPTAPPSPLSPTHNDTPTESPAPSPSPTTTPTKSPADLPCIYADAETYSCGDAITIDFNFDDAYIDDWIGIYPCEVTQFRHSEVWQWTCGEHPDVCPQVVKSGTVVFDSLPSYNVYGPHSWPVAPFTMRNGTVSRCFKAVLLRKDGTSVPPYIDLCETSHFEIMENDQVNGCGIREYSPSLSIPI